MVFAMQTLNARTAQTLDCGVPRAHRRACCLFLFKVEMDAPRSKLACMDTCHAAISALVWRIARDCAGPHVCYNTNIKAFKRATVIRGQWVRRNVASDFGIDYLLELVISLLGCPKTSAHLLAAGTCLPSRPFPCIGNWRHYTHAVTFERSFQLAQHPSLLPLTCNRASRNETRSVRTRVTQPESCVLLPQWGGSFLEVQMWHAVVFLNSNCNAKIHPNGGWGWIRFGRFQNPKMPLTESLCLQQDGAGGAASPVRHPMLSTTQWKDPSVIHAVL